jgi:hypothetical protein
MQEKDLFSNFPISRRELHLEVKVSLKEVGM